MMYAHAVHLYLPNKLLRAWTLLPRAVDIANLSLHKSGVWSSALIGEIMSTLLFMSRVNMDPAKVVPHRVARWHIFKPKIPIWLHFGGYFDGRCWYILRPFGRFCGPCMYFMIIW
jgi:hypothetical protein